MKQNLPLVISINRELGSGGAYLGQRLASRLNMLYLDKEIFREVAQKLGVYEDAIQYRDEKLISNWEFILSAISYAQPEFNYSPAKILPSNKDFFQAESEIISKIATEKSVVIIGRGSSHILRNHSNHVSIFLHANMEFRSNRIQNLYGLSQREAQKLIESTDKARLQFIHTLTGTNLYDARQYHLSIDTGILGFDIVEELILNYLDKRSTQNTY